MCVCVCACVCVRERVFVCVGVCACVFMCVFAYVCISTDLIIEWYHLAELLLHVCVYGCVCIFCCVRVLVMSIIGKSHYRHLYVAVAVKVHACTCMHICTRARACARLLVCVRVCMCVCVCVCVHECACISAPLRRHLDPHPLPCVTSFQTLDARPCLGADDAAPQQRDVVLALFPARKYYEHVNMYVYI